MTGKRLQRKQQERFCRAYLTHLDWKLAADEAGIEDPMELLEKPAVQERLRRGREALSQALCREDVLRRLAQLAFGRAEGAIRLATEGLDALPAGEDLWAVSEFKRGSNGTIEVKLVDRVRALQALYELLGGQDSSQSLCEFFHAMEDEA